jgi:hypothetical protein
MDIHTYIHLWQDAKVVIISPNIEQGPSEGGLDSRVQAILTDCRAFGVPIVFALSRNKLGKAVGKVGVPVCMYACMCVCMYVLYLGTNWAYLLGRWVSMRTCMYACMYVLCLEVNYQIFWYCFCMCSCVCVCVYGVYAYTNHTLKYIYTHVLHTCTHTYIHTHRHTDTHTHTYIHIYTCFADDAYQCYLCTSGRWRVWGIQRHLRKGRSTQGMTQVCLTKQDLAWTCGIWDVWLRLRTCGVYESDYGHVGCTTQTTDMCGVRLRVRTCGVYDSDDGHVGCMTQTTDMWGVRNY